MNYRRLVNVFVWVLLPSLCSCYTTATKAEVDARVLQGEANSFPDKLVFERSDDKYDYYQSVTGLGAQTRGRYRVPRSSDAVKSTDPDILE